MPKMSRWIAVVVLVLLCGAAWGVIHRHNALADFAPAPAAVLIVSSSAFPDGGPMPSDYTCDGHNTAPPLAISAPPAATKTLAVIVDDLDAPLGFAHWLAFNLPPQSPLGVGIQGKNDFDTLGYTGPCPPSGTHRYRFRVYALDTALSLTAGATRSELVAAGTGHALAEGTLTGRYRRQR
jgi:Raf kinase inhibitor-like YbhB/YbcL family protein